MDRVVELGRAARVDVINRQIEMDAEQSALNAGWEGSESSARGGLFR